MSKGILYIAFGSEYDKLTAYTASYSRQYTDLPILVLTNIQEQDRHPKWKEVSGIEFKFFELHQNMNRDIKTKMNEYTTFEETLYLDCDSVIRNPGIEKSFEYLDSSDFVLNKFLHWDVGDKIVRIYKKALLNKNLDLPLDVYNGAFICFRKNHFTQKLFWRWNRYWIDNGSGREMPALSCALKYSSKLIIYNLEKGFFEPDTKNNKCIVQHDYGKGFQGEFNLPKIKTNKPFDTDPTDWNWVRMEDE